MDLLYKMKWINCFLKLFNRGKKMEYLYKYTPHNNDTRKYEIITKSNLWFSKIESFNDPIDSKLDYRQQYKHDEIEEFWKQFLQNKSNVKPLKEILRLYGNNKSFVDYQNKKFDEYRNKIERFFKIGTS